MELCETDCLLSGVWSLTSDLFKRGWKLTTDFFRFFELTILVVIISISRKKIYLPCFSGAPFRIQ